MIVKELEFSSVRHLKSIPNPHFSHRKNSAYDPPPPEQRRLAGANGDLFLYLLQVIAGPLPLATFIS
jgi:hypothetical protein